MSFIDSFLSRRIRRVVYDTIAQSPGRCKSTILEEIGPIAASQMPEPSTYYTRCHRAFIVCSSPASPSCEKVASCGRQIRPSQAIRDLDSNGGPMKRTWTIIGVGDVPRSFKWYQALFGQPATLPAHDYFGQILDSDGTVLLCLHKWGAHEHPSLMNPDHGTPGNGLLLFFRVDDFDLALQRARSLVGRLEEEPHLNSNTRTKEFSLRDLDGYYVTISALSAG